MSWYLVRFVRTWDFFDRLAATCRSRRWVVLGSLSFNACRKSKTAFEQVPVSTLSEEDYYTTYFKCFIISCIRSKLHKYVLLLSFSFNLPFFLFVLFPFVGGLWGKEQLLRKEISDEKLSTIWLCIAAHFARFSWKMVWSPWQRDWVNEVPQDMHRPGATIQELHRLASHRDHLRSN